MSDKGYKTRYHERSESYICVDTLKRLWMGLSEGFFLNYKKFSRFANLSAFSYSSISLWVAAKHRCLSKVIGIQALSSSKLVHIDFAGYCNVIVDLACHFALDAKKKNNTYSSCRTYITVIPRTCSTHHHRRIRCTIPTIGMYHHHSS